MEDAGQRSLLVNDEEAPAQGRLGAGGSRRDRSYTHIPSSSTSRRRSSVAKKKKKRSQYGTLGGADNGDEGLEPSDSGPLPQVTMAQKAPIEVLDGFDRNPLRPRHFVVPVVGIMLIVAGFVLSRVVIRDFTSAAIADRLVVTSETDPGFAEWQRNDSPDAQPQYFRYTFYSVTNPAEVVRGEKPVMRELGPYVYRRYVVKRDINFLENGRKVSFLPQEYFVFQRQLSLGDPMEDTVTNVNLGYLGLLQVTEAESRITIGMTGPALKFIVDRLTLYSTLPPVAPKLQELRGLLVGQNITDDAFLGIWANTTFRYEREWDGMLVSHVPDGNSDGTPSQIPLGAAQRLWAADEEYSLVSSNLDQLLRWFRTDDAETRAMLAERFGLSESQVEQIGAWMLRFRTFHVDRDLLAKYKVREVDDLGILQWCCGDPLGKETAYNLFPSENDMMPEKPEWFEYQSSGLLDGFDFDEAKKLLADPELGIFEADNMKRLLLALQDRDDATLEEFDMSLIKGARFNSYRETVTDTTATKLTEQAFENGGGAIATKTVHNMLWDSVDPLVEYLRPVNSQIRLFTNDTTVESARARTKPSTMWTGKDDVAKIGQLLDHEGEQPVQGWNGPEEVAGTDGLIFAPGMKKSTPHRVWAAEYFRTVDLDYVGPTKAKGIDLWRYHLPKDMFEPADKYYQSIRGFANMTHVRNGIPLFYSKPHFYDVDPEYLDLVGGLNPGARDETYVDVEPISGAVMRAAKKVQLNVYLDKNMPALDMYNQDLARGRVYPLVIVDGGAEISATKADQFKKTVYGARELEDIILFSSVSLGLVLVVAGIVFIIRRRYSGYQRRYGIIAE